MGGSGLRIPQRRIAIRVGSINTQEDRQACSSETRLPIFDAFGRLWLTTLSVAQARTEQIVRLAHLRWDIENHGFNELVNGWHADHVYRHQSRAVACFLLLAFLAYNIFHAFFALNLKPEVRCGKTMAFWIRLIAAEIHAVPRLSLTTPPP